MIMKLAVAFALLGLVLVIAGWRLLVFSDRVVWDPNRIFSLNERMQLGLAIARVPIKTRVLAYRDLTPQSVGREFADKAASKEPMAPGYYPIGEIIGALEVRDGIGEKDTKGQSMLIVVTGLRGNPSKTLGAFRIKPHGRKNQPKSNRQRLPSFFQCNCQTA